MLKLYYTSGTCALASHIALREAGADFELRPVDFATAEQRTPAYKQVNPKGRVPALETDHGVITETPAILTFIAQTHPGAKLAPFGDAFAFARMQSFASYLCATVHVAHAHSRRGERWADDAAAIAEMKRKAPEVMAQCFALIEESLFVGPWVLGDDYCVVDPYLYTLTSWLPYHQIDVAQFPKVQAHYKNMSIRPAVIATHKAELSH